jgi:hypothetical protein
MNIFDADSPVGLLHDVTFQMCLRPAPRWFPRWAARIWEHFVPWEDVTADLSSDFTISGKDSNGEMFVHRYTTKEVTE